MVHLFYASQPQRHLVSLKYNVFSFHCWRMMIDSIKIIMTLGEQLTR